MKRISFEELLGKFHPLTADEITSRAAKCNATHVVVFQNLNLSSPECGHTTAMMVGPTCTYTGLDDFPAEGSKQLGRPLGSVPSRFQYPKFYAEVPSE